MKQNEESGGPCRICGKPRPAGYSVTCGGSYCQEQSCKDNLAQAKRKRSRKGR